ncbi:Cytosine specific DNA methyltransferase replication foci domain [Rhizoctonia solani]|uniref:DNA (cytosine-5-)-methyltransferase n=1 Tax=Rhizoctonia solani TaxID=456999 RepID=A0A8H7H223_9AGAM|nr:Cytosine specific DNA methyltransferase replication foci domain [Rhizoctonia solani]
MDPNNWENSIDWDEYLPEAQIIQSMDDIDLQVEHTDDNRRIFRLENFIVYDTKTKQLATFDISNVEQMSIIGKAIPIFPDINDDDGGRSEYGEGASDDSDTARRRARPDEEPPYEIDLQLSTIQKADYTYLDVSAACCDGIYVLTNYAWYLLQRPSKIYASLYDQPFREFRLVLTILRRAYEDPEERLSEFLPKFRRHATRIDRKYTKATNWGYRELHQMDLQQCSTSIAHNIQDFIQNLSNELESTDDAVQRDLIRVVHDRLTHSRIVDKVLAGNLATIRRRDGDLEPFMDPSPPLSSPPRSAIAATATGKEVIEIEDSSDEEMDDLGARTARKAKVGRQTCTTPIVERAARKVFSHPLNLIGEQLPEVTWRESRARGMEVTGNTKLTRGQCVLVPAGIDKQEPHEDWAFNQNKTKSINDVANKFAQIIDATSDNLHVRWFDHSSKTSLLAALERPLELFLSQRCDDIRRVHVKCIIDVRWLGPDQGVPDYEEGYYVRFIRTLDSSFTWAKPDDIQLDPSTQCGTCDLAKDRQTRFDSSSGTLTLQGLDIHRGDFIVTQPIPTSPWFPNSSIPLDNRRAYPGQIFQVIRAIRSDGHGRDCIVGLVLQPFERVSELRRHGFLDEDHDACPGRPANDERRLCLMDSWTSILEWETLKEYPMRKCYLRHPDSFASHQDMNSWISQSPLHFLVDLRAMATEEGATPDHRFPQDPLLHSTQHLQLQEFQSLAKPCRKCPEELGNSRVTRMRMLDMFSGAGGLSQGLVLSGVCEPKYAIDHDAAALETYKQNFPGVSAIHQDVNVALSDTLVAAVAGHDRAPTPSDSDSEDSTLPGRYDVDFICAGPPCQSFSGANRFRKDTDPRTTMIIAVMAAVDHYRPKYFLVASRSSDSAETDFHEDNYVEQGILRFITRAALDLGYAIRVGILQASEHGAPQHRRRAFIMGARHGHTLPNFPLPSYCVPKPETGLRLPSSRYGDPTHQKDGNVPIVGNGIHRRVTMWDAISDLAPFEWVNPHFAIPETEASRAEDRRRRTRGENRIPVYVAVKDDRQAVGIGAGGPVPYRGDSPFTSYQQEARGSETMVSEHYTSSFKSPLFVERVVNIPLSAKADHRALPEVLKRGDFLSNVFGSGGASGYYQGAFGRYDKKAPFATILTSLRPAKKNGFCIHPDQKRMLTMRELARAQGFPDHFRFHGTVEQVNRQIGNAVVIQVSRAIGLEIKKAILKDGAI